MSLYYLTMQVLSFKYLIIYERQTYVYFPLKKLKKKQRKEEKNS